MQANPHDRQGGRNVALSRLGIEHPIVQGPFGGGLSTVELAATVSELGGMGSFGAHMMPAEHIGDLVAQLRAATARTFAVNLWVKDHDEGGLFLDEAAFERAWRVFEPYYRELDIPRPARYERGHPSFDEQVDALLAAAPPVFSFVFGIPERKVLAECRRRDIVTVGAATSIDEALALEAAGVDLLVVTGAEAGGHRPSFLASSESSLCGTFTLVQLVSRRVRLPVVAAGGIADATAIRAAMTLGAQAAQIGTAFLACEESGASAMHRDLLFDERARRTVLTRAFTGRLARGIRNRWTEEMSARAGELPPFPVTAWFMSTLKHAAIAQGRSDLIPLWSGQIAPNLRHRSATGLMRELIAEL